MWIGIQHAPVEITFAIQLFDTAATLTHLFFFILFQTDTGLLSYTVSPLAGKQGFDHDEVFGVIAHHIAILREFGYLFVKDIVIRFHIGMPEVIASCVHLVTRIFRMGQFLDFFCQ